MSDNMIAMFGTTAFFVALLLWIPLLEGTCVLCRKASSALRRARPAKTRHANHADTFMTSRQKQP